MSSAGSERARAGLVALFVVGGLIRLHNAFAYPPFYGFDVPYNWEYVQLLCAGFQLPHPEAGWAFGHPPLFYWIAALAGRALGCAEPGPAIVAVRLLSSAAGLAAIAAVVALVRRAEPGAERRALFAGGLLLLLPAHVQMSASFGEEMLASSLATGAVVLAALAPAGPRSLRADLGRGALVGLLAGLALLTKLTGVLALAAILGAEAASGWRTGALRRAAARAAAAALVAAAVGGWYYGRNLVQYGYVYPHDLPVHAEMHRQRPGRRTLYDYVYVPRAALTDGRVRHPDMLRSVWGGTYATAWYDGHRHFLPKEGVGVRRLGVAVLALALLPTAAFAVGAWGGLRRALRRTRGPDPVLLLLAGATLAGYAFFTWRNPWWSTVKATYMLGAAAPFAFYASEPLARWSAAPGARGALVRAALAALALLVAAAFSYGLVWAGGGR